MNTLRVLPLAYYSYLVACENCGCPMAPEPFILRAYSDTIAEYNDGPRVEDFLKRIKILYCARCPE